MLLIELRCFACLGTVRDLLDRVTMIPLFVQRYFLLFCFFFSYFICLSLFRSGHPTPQCSPSFLDVCFSLLVVVDFNFMLLFVCFSCIWIILMMLLLCSTLSFLGGPSYFTFIFLFSFIFCILAYFFISYIL